MVINKRKQIDIFLFELNKFIDKYSYWFQEDVEPLFIATFKANISKQQLMASWKKELWLDKLVYYINKNNLYKWNKKRQRKENFIKKIAYWLEYKEVKDFSYEEIFWKIIFNSWNQIFKPSSIIEDIKKPIPFNTFLIPEEWYHNNNIYIYNFK